MVAEPDPAQRGRVPLRMFAPLAIVATLAGCWLLAWLTGTSDLVTAIGLVNAGLAMGGWPVLAYGGASLGLGSWVVRRLGIDTPGALGACVGLACMLLMSHLLGVLGVVGLRFGGSVGTVAAWTPVVLGLALLIARLRSFRPGACTCSLWWLVGALPISVLLVASLQTPGYLWPSEFGGFDALSYHLQLPREWLTAGAIAPLEHNVYSYLPSHVEGAFYHLGAMMGGVGDGWPLVGSGHWLVSCQLLHAGSCVLGAWACGSAALASARRWVVPQSPGWIGWCCGMLVLGTPWSIVVGSLAYNEMVVVALGAGAVLCGAQVGAGSPAGRSALAALLVGAACGAKPTAIFLVAPIVGVVLIAGLPRERRVRAIIIGLVIGLATLAPWLIRNALAAGNPVFPALTGVFGPGHWSPEQIERFTAAHTFQGSPPERAALTVLADPADPAGARHRGFLHPQWGIFWIATGAALIAGLAAPGARRGTVLLGTGTLVSLGAWLMLTHIQSRFLIPIMVGAVPLMGLGIASLATRLRPLAIIAGAILIGGQLLALIPVLPVNDRGLHLLSFSLRFGTAPWISVPESPGPEWAPTSALVSQLPPDSRTLLLGVSTPLYYGPSPSYSTTWDAGVPVELGADPTPGESWTVALRDAGYTHVVIDFNELARLVESGYADPRLTPESVGAWVRDAGLLPVHGVREGQPRRGPILFELP